MLLREGREDEIGVRDRQEAELGLCAVRHSAPPHAAVSHRNLGLNHLIAGAARIAGRVEKRHQALPLIILQKVPADRQSECAYQRDDRQISPSNSGYQNPDGQDRQVR